MKKIILIFLIIIVLIVGATLALPVFFKKNLLEVTKNTLNKKLNAKVEFADIKLSLFRNFPQASAEFNEVTIKGKGVFQNDTLLYVDLVRTKMDLASLFRKTGMSIGEIILEKAKMNLIVAESGEENWDIAKEQTPAATSTENARSETNEFQLQLEKIEIRNAELSFADRKAKMKLELAGIHFDISGSMYGNSTALKTEGRIDDCLFRYEDVNYISNTSMDIRTLLDADFDKMKFYIAENELMVNRLPMELSGSVELPSDTTFVNLQLKTKKSDFASFLALVPPVYEKYLSVIEAQGSATISGGVSGFYVNENYPQFSLEMHIANGNFHYAELPEEIKNIKANVSLTKPQGEFDLTEINIKEAHAEIRNNPVDFTAKVINPVSDPYFDMAFVGKINLNHLKDALPIDSVNMWGTIDANLFAMGNYSDLEAEAYDKIKSDGVVLLDNFVYESTQLTQKIVVPSGKLDFSPQNVNLSEFNIRVGQSDFHLSGKVTNYLNYMLKGGVLKGSLQLYSRMVNLNELLRLQVKSPEEIASAQSKKNNSSSDEITEDILAFDIPENIDILFNSTIENALFDRIPINHIKGSIRAVEEKFVLENLNMLMLDGELKMNGSYKNTESNQPYFDFGFNIAAFDIPTMYNTVSGARKLMPAARNSQGELSSDLRMKGRLSPQLKLIPSTANGKGKFSTVGVEIKDSPLFNQLSGILKKEKLRNVNIDDFTAYMTVENGNLILSPFTTKVIGQETRVQGSLNAESLLDMRLDFNIERSMFGPDIQKFLNIIPGNEKIKMLPAGVNIDGPADDPKVSLDLSATQKAVANATKDDIQKSLEKLGKGLKRLFK